MNQLAPGRGKPIESQIGGVWLEIRDGNSIPLNRAIELIGQL